MSVTVQDISLGEFVKQLAALLQGREVDLPLKNQKPWHLLFYDLKESASGSGRPSFLDNLVFDWDAPYPKCQELSDFLNAMHFTASVSARNPHFDVIDVGNECVTRWTEQLNQNDPELRDFFEKAADLAHREFAA